MPHLYNSRMQVLLALLVLLKLAWCAPWTLTHETILCNASRTVHWFKASNGTSVVHFVFAADTHIRPPTVIVLNSNFPMSKITVDCARFSNETATANFRGSVTAEAITASYGVVVFALCEYDDARDVAAYTTGMNCHMHFGGNLRWELSSVYAESPDKLSVTFRGTRMNDSHDIFMDGGAFILKFSIFDSDSLPPNDFYYNVAGGVSMAITLTIDRMATLNRESRFAPVLLVFSNQSMEDDDDFRALDAGASDGPGGSLKSSYLILNERVRHPVVEPDSPPAFIQFPHASWTTSHAKDALTFRQASLGPRHVFTHKGKGHTFTRSLALAYYGARFNPIHQGSHVGHVGVRMQFINMGSPGDGFYRASNYSSWTMILSLGSPALNPPSTRRTALLVTFSILVCLLLVSGMVYGCYRRQRWRRQTVRRFESLPPLDAIPPSPPVEPFQARKSGHPTWSRRNESSQPLLSVEPLQDYHST